MKNALNVTRNVFEQYIIEILHRKYDDIQDISEKELTNIQFILL
jgi:hypothetical protein